MATLFELAARLQAADAAEGLLLIVLKATLILAIARLLLAAIPRAAAATKHVVATAALVAIAALPLLSAAVPAWNVVFEQQPAPQANIKDRLALEDAPVTGAPRQTAAPATLGTALSVAKTFVPDEPLTAMQRGIVVVQSTWKGMIVVAIGLIALLMTAQMLIGMAGVWHVSRHAEELTQDEALRELDAARDRLALRTDVRLLRSSRISVPVIWGVFRPVLLLPADVVTWPVERLRVVLLHELAHLKRYDGVSLILTRIAVSMFWFHPLAWTLERAGRSECERACDDLVLTSGTKASDYADHLLAIARSMPTFDPFRSVTLAMSRKSQLEGRLLSILQPHVARRVFSGRGVAIACALAVAVIVPVSALRLTAEPPDSKRIAEQQKQKQAETQKHEKEQHHTYDSDSEIDVTDDIESIQDFLMAKLGKLDRRADRLARQPRNGKEWYERGYDYYRTDRYADAAAAFARAAQEDYAAAKSLYNAACSHALNGNADQALVALKGAIDAGWDDFDHIAEDSDFDPIRSDPRFAQMLKADMADAATRRVTETVERYEDLKQTREVKHKGDDWFEVGHDLLRLRKLDDSIQAFQKAIAANENVSSSMYNIACAYSLKNDARNGLAWLDKAIEHGFSNDEKLAHDPDVAFLRQQSGFAALAEKAKDMELRGDHGHEKWTRFIGDITNDWSKSVAHHRQVTQKYPSSGRAWFNLGYTQLRAGEQKPAIDAFRRAIELDHRVATSSYNVACAYALAGDRDLAFEWLKRAKDAGFELDHYIDEDDDLDSIRRDPRFKALRAAAMADADRDHHD